MLKIKRGIVAPICLQTPSFRGVTHTSVSDAKAHVLLAKVQVLLAKGVQEKSPQRVRPLQPLLSHPQEGWRTQDLPRLNRALIRWPFRMLTLKQILLMICPGDWDWALAIRTVPSPMQISAPCRSQGFMINLSKSLLLPSQRITFLGAVFDLSQIAGLDFARTLP